MPGTNTEVNGAESPIPHRTEGEPLGTGICLSGGGIRAASFGLGALQALDRELSLLYGDRSADYLAAVSGGSYVAATSTLIARQLASGAEVTSSARPLSEGSPEANRIIGRGDYLRRWPGDRVKNWVALALVALLCVGGVAAGAPWWIGVVLLLLALGAACARWLLTALVFGFTGLLNVAGFVVLVLLVASLVVAVDALWTRIPGSDDLPLRWIARPEDVGRLAALATALAALTGGRLVLRSLYRFRWDHRGLVLGLALAFVGAPGLAAVLGYHTVWVLVLALTLTVGMMLTSGETSETQLWKRAIRVAVPFAGLVALWAMVWSVRELVERGDRLWLIFVVPGAFLMSQVVGRISLHHLYRGRLAATFCVRRPVTGRCAVTVPPREPLSDLACDTHDPRKCYPRLLICATVNVKTDAWPQTDWQRCQPFVFSPERCGLGMAPDGSFATKKLEAARRPAFFRHDPCAAPWRAVAWPSSIGLVLWWLVGLVVVPVADGVLVGVVVGSAWVAGATAGALLAATYASRNHVGRPGPDTRELRPPCR